MSEPEQHTTQTPPAVTLDYAGPMSTGSSPASQWKTRVLEGLIGLGIILLLITIILPTNHNGGPAVERVVCAAMLRSVGQALHMYANDHRGAFPDTLEKVVSGGYAPDVRIFLCPACEDTPARGATRAALAADLTAGGHLSYVYVGRGLTHAAGPSVVLAYEHAGHHEGKGGNVLFADGHVTWHHAAELRAVIDWHAAGHGPMRWGQATTSQPTRRPISAEPATRPHHPAGLRARENRRAGSRSAAW